MTLNDTRLRNLKPSVEKSERLVADGNGLYELKEPIEEGVDRTEIAQVGTVSANGDKSISPPTLRR